MSKVVDGSLEPAGSGGASESAGASLPGAPVASPPPADPLIEKKRALAQLVVHDLRNPLTAAHGYTQLVKAELRASKDPARAEEYLHDVTTLIEKALGLVATILDVEELEDGVLRARPSPVALRPVISRALTGQLRQIELRGIGLTIDGVLDEPVTLDEDLISRVIENLLDNSLRYAPRGGRVVATVRWVGDELELAIGNSGPPVPDADRDAIFGRYYQSEARRASARANRGLGLYFCRLAVAAHGGTIAVESRGELGAVFVVRIPRRVAAG